MHKIESPKHTRARTFLRVVGPFVVLVGIVLIGVAFISFFSSMDGGGPPRLFWCAFVGMPLLFVGIVMCKLGFIGAVIRYMAAETAPVAKDTVNYMADETQEAVKTVARAITEGIEQGKSKPPNGPPTSG